MEMWGRLDSPGHNILYAVTGSYSAPKRILKFDSGSAWACRDYKMQLRWQDG
jgi:hypothetical protein